MESKRSKEHGDSMRPRETAFGYLQDAYDRWITQGRPGKRHPDSLLRRLRWARERWRRRPLTDMAPLRAWRPLLSAEAQHAPSPDYSIDEPGKTLTPGEIRAFSRGYDEGFEAAKTLPHGIHARLAAATAVIERVRAECLRACPDGHGSVNISTARLWPALAAAPEHTGPDTSGPCGCAAAGRLVTVCDAHRDLAAANARVAELEGQCAMGRDTIASLRNTVAHQNEVVKLFEADERVMRQDCEHHMTLAHRAESEAAALRAENADLMRRISGAQQMIVDLRSELARKEKTAAAYHVAERRLAEAPASVDGFALSPDDWCIVLGLSNIDGTSRVGDNRWFQYREKEAT